jgi:hypothetical protein
MHCSKTLCDGGVSLNKGKRVSPCIKVSKLSIKHSLF